MKKIKKNHKNIINLIKTKKNKNSININKNLKISKKL